MAADTLALFYSLLGGFFMGSYPVPIKTPSVIAAQAHPIIFQVYKSFWVFITGFVFVLANWLMGKEFVFEFSWWGVASAAAWIPSGLGTIAAVPRLGIGVAIVVNAGMAATLSFLVFWLVLGESMREHRVFGHSVYLAPAFLVFVVLGMAALVAAPRAKCGKRDNTAADSEPPSSDAIEAVGRGPYPPRARARLVSRDRGDDGTDSADCGQNREAEPSAGSRLAGLVFAFLAGVFSAAQFGILTIAKKAAQRDGGCATDMSACSPRLQETFNVFGSWMASFGIGAALVTALILGFWVLSEQMQGRPKPNFHLKALLLPGSIAGVCWSLGNIFQAAAVLRGGNAVMMPANLSIQLITSGAWGLLYYGEVRGSTRIALWLLAAAWTVAAIVLLSGEKG